MFFNVLIIFHLLIAKEHTCSGEKSPTCSPVDYPVTPDWVFEGDTPAPANLTQNLTAYDNGSAVLLLSVYDQREDFDVTLLVNPFLKNGSENPPELNTSDYNLRQYYRTCEVPKDDGVFERVIDYEKVVTGWYYFVITNRNGTRWKSGAKFYRTNHPFIDMGVRFENKGENPLGDFKPETAETNMSYYTSLRVPLDCIVVRVKIYENEKKVDGAIGHIIHGRLPEAQTCWISNIGNNTYARCERNSHIYLNVTSRLNKTDDTWIVDMTWNNLARKDENYHLDHSNFDTRLCDQKFGAHNVEIWRPINGRIYYDLKVKRLNARIHRGVRKENFIQPQDWLRITCFLVSFISVTIIFYWVRRWRRLNDFLKEYDERAGIRNETSESTKDKKSNQILLLYVNGCPGFENEVKYVEEHLRRCCSGYRIRDVYAPSEFKYVGDVKKWVHEILDAGSKVIWFDTPELRSRLNRQDHTWNDYRDEAVPYAFELARDLYQDAHSQYCYHFVVQLKKFKVENDEGNPLKMFTPETRWLLPDYLSHMCKKLNGLIVPFKEHHNCVYDLTAA